MSSINNLFDVSGKVAVVTGGSRGIGRMIAEGFVRNGVRVYITARKAEACDQTAAELSEFGECISIPADLANTEDLERFAGEIAGREPKLDILVNNAGASWGAPIDEFPESGFDKVLTVNVKAPFMLTQALLPQLRAAASFEDPARVIMVGSIDGLKPAATDSFSYSASKAGIHQMARHMAHRVHTDHITINCIAPGPFESKMMAFALDDPTTRAGIERSVPLGRIGRPDDMAGIAIFLSSRAGSYLTGAVIPVDGGISSS